MQKALTIRMHLFGKMFVFFCFSTYKLFSKYTNFDNQLLQYKDIPTIAYEYFAAIYRKMKFVFLIYSNLYTFNLFNLKMSYYCLK